MVVGKINRRDFIKKAALAFGAVAAGRGIIKAAQDEATTNRIRQIHEQIDAKKGLVTRHPSSFTKVMEGLPDIATKEISLIKQHGERGIMYDVSVKREPNGVTYPETVVAKARSHIHQHPYFAKESNQVHYSYPGIAPDMVNYLELLAETGKRHVKHVITVDAKGKVMGSVSICMTNKFLADKQKFKEFQDKITSLAKRQDDPATGYAALQEYVGPLWELKKQGYMQIKIHAVNPTKTRPGYTFNGMTFVEKKN